MVCEGMTAPDLAIKPIAFVTHVIPKSPPSVKFHIQRVLFLAFSQALSDFKYVDTELGCDFSYMGFV